VVVLWEDVISERDGSEACLTSNAGAISEVVGGERALRIVSADGSEEGRTEVVFDGISVRDGSDTCRAKEVVGGGGCDEGSV